MSRLAASIAKRGQKRLSELTRDLGSCAYGKRAQGTGRSYTCTFINRMLTGYDVMVRQRLDEGYEAYFMTLMFDQIPGSKAAVAAEMERAVEAIYSATLTQVLKKPHTAWNRAHPLIWLCCPDYPVPKRGKQPLRDVVVNDGRHFHVIVLVPPFTRLHRSYDVMVGRERERFTPAPVCRVDVRHIIRTPGRVVGYNFKQLPRRRCDFDEVVVLPRVRAELPGYVDPRWRAARRRANDAPVPRKHPWTRHRRSAQAGMSLDSRADR